ncbi:MAG: SCO family protein [candidate division NC10 bacterium]|nr:SCO family protein [candidate division NC10 bacterium]
MMETAFSRQHLGVGLLTVALAGVLGVAVWTWQGAWRGQGSQDDRPLEGLRIFGTVPDFSLIERSGRRITLAELRGRVWIANFIYTHCTDTCPLQSARMARLQADFSPELDVRLVSITVDPEQDTPAVLVEYANRFGADRDRWLFLTGEKKAIYTLALEGFRLSVADPGETVQPPPGGPAPTGRSDARQGQSSIPRRAPGRVEARILSDAAIWLVSPVVAFAHPGHPGKPFIHSSRFALVDRQARIRGYYHSDDEEALGRLRRDAQALLRENRP